MLSMLIMLFAKLCLYITAANSITINWRKYCNY